MSKEIKFRAWCKEDIKRGKPLKFIHLVDKNGECWFAMEEDNGFRYPYQHILFNDNWIKEQFTGLLDKNGKEIYEGDILKSISVNNIERNYLYRVYVGIDGAYRYEIQYRKDAKWKRSASQTINSLVSERAKEYYEVEVIGNIHDEVIE